MEEFMLIDSKGSFNFDFRLWEAVFNSAVFSKNINNNKKIRMFREDIDIVDFWSDLFERFNIKSSLSVVEKFDNYYEIFGFTTRFNKSLYSFYMNHYDVIENFMMYFKEHGSDLIRTAEKNKINIHSIVT